MAGDIKSECRARSSRNRGRLPSESASTASPNRVRGQDSHVTRWSGPSRVTGIGEAKPHRRAFPGGRWVQGNTRLVDRSVGQTTPRRLAAPAYQAVDRCWSQTARELALIY